MVGIEDFLKYKSLSDLKISPDESKAAFIIMQPCLNSNDYQKELWICDISEDVKKNRFKKIIDKDEMLFDFTWIDNGTLFYPARYEKNSTICRSIDVISGDIKDEVAIPAKATGIWRVAMDSYIFCKEECISKEEYPEELRYLERFDAGFEMIDEIPVYENGKGFVSGKRKALYFWQKGASARRLTPEETTVDIVRQKKEGLYFTARTYRGRNTEPGIYFVNIKGGFPVLYVPEGRYRISEFDAVKSSKTGQATVYFTAQDKQAHIMTSDPGFYMADNNGVTKMQIPEASVGDSVVSDCIYGNYQSFAAKNDRLFYLVTEQWGSYVKSAAYSGAVQCLTPEGGSVNGFAVLSDGGLLLIGLREQRQQELYYCKHGVLTKLSSFNDPYSDGKETIKPDTFTFQNHGFQVNYMVLAPYNVNRFKKYPAILYIHGGAKILYSTVFFHEMQYLASCGYYVIYGNPHGSDGQGSEFAKLLGQYGEKDFDDMMKAMDEALVRYPNIDKNRLGVAGGSYGGIMTNWIVTHTNRFRAAVAQRSICNMVSTFGTADNGFNFVKEQMDGDLWQGFDMLWKQSPLKYANQCSTPLLLIHSDEDYRCHYTEAIQMFTALKYLGVESKVVLIHGENHSLSRTGHPVQRIKRLYEIRKWFDGHLREAVD